MAGAMVRWDPLVDLPELRTLLLGEQPEWFPAIDMVQRNGDLVVRADVPGMKPEEIKIDIEGGVLTISGEHEESSEDTSDERFVRRERRYGRFSRSMTLPEGVDVKKIAAAAEDGVLELTIPVPQKTASEKVSITPKAGK